ncbi:MAG: glutamine--fructose-6-phosphate transaminase (isomerizing) [Deltaproteobacteria bacterium]|nr:glutamine--fructose-6-phosphate transaminase (isomerizing) [Deltaproteobacteria bacterium]
MCGIVGYVGHQPCGSILIEGLRRLEYRGYDSAGLAIYNGEELIRVRSEGKLANLERAFMAAPVVGTVGIAHTRWATHGRPVEKNAHPHRVGDIVVVHNGIIENYAELRAELMAGGAVFESDTDTEVAAQLIAKHRGSFVSLHETVRFAISLIRGSYALVVLDGGNPDEIVAARQASPLVLGLGEGEQFAASDVPAIMAHTRNVIFLMDGDSAILRREGISVFDESGAPVERPVKRIAWDPISAEKQGYKHFMLKEIHEQPARIVDTLRGRIAAGTNMVEIPELNLEPAFLREIDRIIIIACGTSYHSGMVARYTIESLARVPVELELASEFRYRDPVVTERTLAIAISQSGETADTLAAIREAKRLGAKTAAVCNVMESTIARECGSVIYTQAGPEIGVASTKAFTTQLTALYLFALWLAQHRGLLDDAEKRAELVGAFRQIPGMVEQAIGLEPQIRAMAKELVHATSCLFLGRGAQFPIALEGALKLKEISYIHAEGYAAGEMKHGPIALIDESLPVVVIAPENGHFEKVMSNVEEVKARGGRLIVVTTAGAHGPERFADHVFIVPKAHPLFESIVTVIPLQLLSYCVADAKGTDVDQPRNLAKSVTVE